MANKKNQVAKAKNTAIAEMDFESHEGAGLESVTSDDMLIPRLTILQALSPQLNKKKPEFIDGAGIGDIADVGTNEVFEVPIEFLPVKFEKSWLEWAPRDSDKGLVAIHQTRAALDGCEQNEKGQWVNGDGNIIQETSQFFGLNLAADNRKCFIAFSSTQLRKAKKWNTLAMSEKAVRSDGSKYTPPLFYRAYKLDTADESNNQGDWAGWKIDRSEKLDERDNGAELFKEALEFYNQLVDGKAKADHSDTDNKTASTSDSEGAM